MQVMTVVVEATQKFQRHHMQIMTLGFLNRLNNYSVASTTTVIPAYAGIQRLSSNT
jgi:hypothetical protein